MVIICRDIRCFMLALVYLENVMGDIQYKMWFSIRVRGARSPSPPLFTGVELKLCFLLENVNIFK